MDAKELESVTHTWTGSELAGRRGWRADRYVNSSWLKRQECFGELNSVWRSGTFNLSTTSVVLRLLPTAIYSCETWTSAVRIQQKLNVFHQSSLRRICGGAWTDHVTNCEVLKRTDQRPLLDIVAERRFKFAGHTLRQVGTRPAKWAM